MTTKTAKNLTIELPTALAGVALIDAPTAASVGCMSVSWWHEEVRAGRAPIPVIRKPRCTRWRVEDVAGFWADLAAAGYADQANNMAKGCRRRGRAYQCDGVLIGRGRA